MTAAGTVTPARVLVLGAGVAGLQAIATARRLGAVVQAFDTRPVVREQVESLGATFLTLPLRGERARTRAAMRASCPRRPTRASATCWREPVREADVIITTAHDPRRPRARADHARRWWPTMRPGSVIVDLAADAGRQLRADACRASGSWRTA